MIYEVVDKLCYLGDVLSQEGGCEHAILKRIQIGWLKFRELSGLLIGKGMRVVRKSRNLDQPLWNLDQQEPGPTHFVKKNTPR